MPPPIYMRPDFCLVCPPSRTSKWEYKCGARNSSFSKSELLTSEAKFPTPATANAYPRDPKKHYREVHLGLLRIPNHIKDIQNVQLSTLHAIYYEKNRLKCSWESAFMQVPDTFMARPPPAVALALAFAHCALCFGNTEQQSLPPPIYFACCSEKGAG